jgi:hypothetical protein
LYILFTGCFVDVDAFCTYINCTEYILERFGGIMPLFFLFQYTVNTFIHSFQHIYTVHSTVVIHRGSSQSPHRWSAQWEKSPSGAKTRIELGPPF